MKEIYDGFLVMEILRKHKIDELLLPSNSFSDCMIITLILFILKACACFGFSLLSTCLYALTKFI